MKTYSTKKPVKKLVTINLDIEVSEEDQVRALIKKGHDLLETLESIKEGKLARATSEIEKTKQAIADIGKE